MPFSKRSLEGYLCIDSRAGPGLAASPDLDTMPIRGGSLFESATVTCSHCQRQVVLNPDRSRSRGYCSKCDHYLCDQCEAVRAATGICRPWKQVMDDFEKSILKQEARNG